jgi:Zn-dependent protease
VSGSGSYRCETVDPPSGDLRDYEPIQPSGGFDWRELLRKVWAPIAVVGALALKFGVGALKFGSIFIAVGGYALIWGWSFAVGFVLLILVHELGHFLEARRQGLRPALPVFIPFLGAYVSIRDAKIGPWRHALISLAGPVAGGIGAALVWLAADVVDSNLLRALAYTGFLLNLFNLIPVGILDGGQIMRSYRYLKLGGARQRSQALGALYGGVAVLLVLGMFGAHVSQSRL